MDWTEDFDTSLLDEEALRFLIEGHLDGAAKGITTQVISHGVESLSPQQRQVFKKYVVDVWLDLTCKCCQCHIEGHELIGAWETDGYCGSCGNRMYKEARKEGLPDPF